MRYIATIVFQFDDTSEERATTRATELAEWMSDNLAGAYGSDSNLTVTSVFAAEIPKG